MSSDTVYRAATHLLHDGYSVIPIGRDKRPSGRHLPEHGGRRSWTPYRSERALETELRDWYGYEHAAPGVGIVCGRVSRDLLVLDLESEKAWTSMMFLAEDDREIMQLLSETSVSITPSGGRHVYLHMQSAPPAGKVLARDLEGDVWIETRGEGHYVVAPGSLAEVHSSMRLYQWLRYLDPEHACVWPDAAVTRLLSMCERLGATVNGAHQTVQSVPTPAPGLRPAGQVQDGPGAIYNQRGSWRDLLVSHGWTELGTHGGITRWRRPGKSDGISATTGHCRGDVGGDLLYVFSSNAAPFEPGRTYSIFGARAALMHGGDHSACARELRDLGYVADAPACGVLVEKAKQNAAENAQESGEKKRRYKFSSELRRVEDDKKWIVHGILSAGQTTILSAHPKAGKTTLLAHMIRALGTGEQFLDRATRPCKVLVMSEEDEPTIADRIADLGIGDYCAWYVRPFPVRPTKIQWQEWVAAVIQDCQEVGAEVVIIDTMSRNLPISDENDATDVDNALQPLWELNRAGVAIVLVHHIRKSVAAGDDTITSSRGSIAFNGFAEIILNLSKINNDADSTQRHLSGDSRASHVPKDLVIDLVDGRYVVAGDLRQAEAARDRAKLLAALTAEPTSARDCAIKSELPQARTERLLHDLMVAGRVRQSGDGSRGSIYRYQLVEGDASCR